MDGSCPVLCLETLMCRGGAGAPCHGTDEPLRLEGGGWWQGASVQPVSGKAVIGILTLGSQPPSCPLFFSDPSCLLVLKLSKHLTAQHATLQLQMAHVKSSEELWASGPLSLSHREAPSGPSSERDSALPEFQCVPDMAPRAWLLPECDLLCGLSKVEASLQSGVWGDRGGGQRPEGLEWVCCWVWPASWLPVS